MYRAFIITFLLLFQSFFSIAQPNTKQPFYKESFNNASLPDGWYIPPVGNWDPQWIVTNQPYPGSYKYQQQAPPIASKSRGYHLQFQAGYFSDEDVDSWLKQKKYPDGYIISAPINCSGKNSVILKFYESFRWWNYHPADTAGLFVGVSTDKVHWQQWDMRRDIKPATDMLIPLKEEINISQWAAHQPQIYLRFYWKGLQAWYWMIDDIELYEADKKDMSIVRCTSHTETNNIFTNHDNVKILISNNGTEPVQDSIFLTMYDNNKLIATQIFNAKNSPLQSNETKEIIFKNIDLTKSPIHCLTFKATMQGDETPSNNEFHTTIYAANTSLKQLTAWHKIENGIELECGVTRIKVLFYRDNIFRIWLSADGNYTQPDVGDIVVDDKMYNPGVTVSEDTRSIQLKTSSCKLMVNKNPVLFSLFNHDGKELWTEKEPLSFGGKTTQTLTYKPDEYFYGCGMQNGYFSHKNSLVFIEKGGGWDNGGRPNPAPFYMSNYGYGALRNTFDAGMYDFSHAMKFSHNENRFDCFYFVGNDLKDVLDGYTKITGRPFMPARWQLSMGDANCYNRGEKGGTGAKGTTPDVIKLIADKYVEYNMPRGWILPNDGYGCGYVKLDSTIKELAKRGFHTGLWTENGIEKIKKEVGEYGSRLCKLDVAWVGPGYKFALDACKAAYRGIEDNSNSRGFVWSVMGWAGTQRYSVMWTGDQRGNWEYIRFHIPTVIGSGLSAQNCATGDVDGIFGGSDSTYTRDLQWKCFTPVLMVMSGWAKKDKQPWQYGEPYTSINKKYLQLKMQLTPYMYTLMHEAHETGTPAVRGLVLEYPKDTTTWSSRTQYEYLLGKSFLVAPVYKSGETRDSIYFPDDEWYDYWDGTVYKGRQWLQHYHAPLDKLPLFVKAGSIIPMYPVMNYDGEKKLDTLFLDIYPKNKFTYTLYEDDGSTKEYKNGKFATTEISSLQTNKQLIITVNAAKGSYENMLTDRNYSLYIHTKNRPGRIFVNNKAITTWKFDANEKNGLLKICTEKLSVHDKTVIYIK